MVLNFHWCGFDVVLMWFWCGSDVVLMWDWCGIDMGNRWLGKLGFPAFSWPREDEKRRWKERSWDCLNTMASSESSVCYSFIVCLCEWSICHSFNAYFGELFSTAMMVPLSCSFSQSIVTSLPTSGRSCAAESVSTWMRPAPEDGSGRGKNEGGRQAACVASMGIGGKKPYFDLVAALVQQMFVRHPRFCRSRRQFLWWKFWCHCDSCHRLCSRILPLSETTDDENLIMPCVLENTHSLHRDYAVWYYQCVVLGATFMVV